MKKKLSITVDEKVLKEVDSIVDNILIKNRSQAIEYLVKSSLGENRKAAILSGGEERSQLIEKGVYRLTAQVRKKRVVELALKKLRENYFKEVFVIARHAILTKVFEIVKEGTEHSVKVSYVEEKSSTGTADSLRLLKGKVNSPFLVVYGDIIFNMINVEELWKQHVKSNAVATLLLTTSAKPSEKGNVKMEGSRILEFVQKPKHSDVHLVFSPIFVAEPQLLDYEGSSLEYDVFPRLAEQGLLQGHISSEKEMHVHSIKDVRRYCQ